MIKLGVQSEILADIRGGKKTIEGRLAKGKFLDIKPGDIISLREDIYEHGVLVLSVNSGLKIKVESIERFDSFATMLKTVDYKPVIPSANSFDEALAVYRRYYSPEDEGIFGVIAIRFSLY